MDDRVLNDADKNPAVEADKAGDGKITEATVVGLINKMMALMDSNTTAYFDKFDNVCSDQDNDYYEACKAKQQSLVTSYTAHNTTLQNLTGICSKLIDFLKPESTSEMIASVNRAFMNLSDSLDGMEIDDDDQKTEAIDVISEAIRKSISEILNKRN